MSSVREINIKCLGHYYSDDIVNFKDLSLDRTLVYESHIKIISFTLNEEKPMHISFESVDGCTKKLGRIKCLIPS